MARVHDNEIISYVVDLEKRYIVLDTKYLHREAGINVEVRIEFINVGNHFFYDVLQHNIILDIDEYSIEKFIEVNREFLKERKAYGVPIYYETEQELIAKLNNMKQKCFSVLSSVGLAGWVLAESMEVTEREIDYAYILNKHILARNYISR